ncbi:unnamed protein product [Malus baccata var. baccata]
MTGSVSSGVSNTMSSSQSNSLLKHASDDVGWEYGVLVNPTDSDKVQCKLCKKTTSGGVYRMNQHIANIKGNVAGCAKSLDEDKAKLRGNVQLQHIEEEEGIKVVGSKKRPCTVGLMDRFASTINTGSSNDGRKGTRQQNINDAIWKNRTHQVDQYLARWVYEAGIPFHVIDNDNFKLFLEAVGQFGMGYQPPTQYDLREPLLKEQVERVKNSLKRHEEEWALNGCSIMTDAWSEKTGRSIMNLCVNCKKGTVFLSSKECSTEIHIGEYIFEYVDKCIEEVGPLNVVQVVTDNAYNNMAAANMMKLKRPNMFWTSCATHTLNLMIQGIGCLPRFKRVINKAKAFTIFIYAHHKTLALMRKYMKKRDIVRPEITRFATSFLTLQSLSVKRNDLRIMVFSDEWEQCKHSKSTKGKMAYATMMSAHFWEGVSLCLKVFEPLFKLLRLVDGGRKPSMGFLYGELQKARNEIKEALKNNEANYRQILQIIDEKARDQLDGPLHLAAYFLNPYYFFKDQSIQHDPLVMDAMFTCVENFLPDNYEVQNKVINIEMSKYKKREGGFGRHLAEIGCIENDDNYDLVSWWSTYGNHVPNLQIIAIKILSLTTSSSSVQSNAKIMTKKEKENGKKMDILLASEASMVQGWIVEGGDEEVELDLGMDGEALEVDSSLDPKRSSRNVEVRELHEEDFVSDEDMEEEGDEEVAFELERVFKGHGKEEIEA